MSRKSKVELDADDEFKESDIEESENEESDNEGELPENIEEVDDEIEDDDDLGDDKEIDDEDIGLGDDGEKCLYNNVDDELDDSDDDLSDDDIDPNDQTIVSKDQRITKPMITKYEYVRVYGDRVQQLSLGAKPMIKDIGNMSEKEIALREIREGVCPIIIRRPLPMGKVEEWSVNELEKDHIEMIS